MPTATLIEQTQMPVPAAAFQVCRVVWTNPLMSQGVAWAEMYRVAWEHAQSVAAAERFRRSFQSSLN